jgi:hypothetical protein
MAHRCMRCTAISKQTNQEVAGKDWWKMEPGDVYSLLVRKHVSACRAVANTSARWWRGEVVFEHSDYHGTYGRGYRLGKQVRVRVYALP